MRFLAFSPAHQELQLQIARRPQRMLPSWAAVVRAGRASSPSTNGPLSAPGPTSGTALRATTTTSMQCHRNTGTRSTCIERSKGQRTKRSTASSLSIATPEASRWFRTATPCRRTGVLTVRRRSIAGIRDASATPVGSTGFRPPVEGGCSGDGGPACALHDLALLIAGEQ